MLFQETPPDTSLYMIAGYAAFTLILLIYLLSLMLRRRNLEQDLSALESIRAETKAPEAKTRPRNKKTSKSASPKAGRRRSAGRKATSKK